MQPLFYLLSAVAIGAGLAMVLQRHPLPAAFALVLSFLGLAGLYALLSAPLLAILQVLVYAGAIMALVVFVIMLLNVQDADLPAEPSRGLHTLGGFAIAGALFALLLAAIQKFDGGPAVLKPGFGTIHDVGQVLFTQFTFPFEVISILLTVAVVSVVVLAKRRI
ncbi:MAG: NADH-quinone oxidoreductase subunit J [Candidatus Sericytochromatia bacterium]|nr:NADH-quinone oxidoreductase subunit J [Candidatus Sericytochromatia bacterium]